MARKKSKSEPIEQESPSVDAEIDGSNGPTNSAPPADDPVEAPPAEEQSVEEQSADAPPAEEQSADAPPAEEQSADAPVATAESAATPVDLPNFENAASAEPAQTIEMLGDVDLDVKIELGRCQMLVEDVLRLSAGSIVELDKLAGDPVDVLVNERLIARGEVLVVNDNFCVRINEILSPEA